jgi:hypothetical protein
MAFEKEDQEWGANSKIHILGYVTGLPRYLNGIQFGVDHRDNLPASVENRRAAVALLHRR